MLRPATFALAQAIATACLISTTPVAHGVGFEWQRSDPAAQGMDAGKLEAMAETLARRRTRTLLVIRNDTIVWEWYAPGFNQHRRDSTASLTKSLASLSLTVAMNDGRMGPDDPAYLFIPAWRKDPVRGQITIRHLATYSSGIEDATEDDWYADFDRLAGWKGEFWRGRRLGERGLVKAKRNPFTIALHDAPVIATPGSRFVYSNPGMAALAFAVTAAIAGTRHNDVRTLLRRRIMQPIGVRDGEWKIGYDRIYLVDRLPVVAWGGGSFTARAMARVGRLMLRKGNWEGRQVLRRRWVEQMIAYADTPQARHEPGNPHPLPAMVWYNNANGVWDGVPRDAFCGGGAGNQHLLVVPSLNLIVVRTGSAISDPDRGQGFWGGAYEYLFRPVVAAVTD